MIPRTKRINRRTSAQSCNASKNYSRSHVIANRRKSTENSVAPKSHAVIKTDGPGIFPSVWRSDEDVMRA
jgi:hypothetical protein